MTDLYPMLIAPRYDERIWGGHNLAGRSTRRGSWRSAALVT